MSSSENFSSYAPRWSATHGEGVVRGWLAFVFVVARSQWWLTRQAALLLGRSGRVCWVWQLAWVRARRPVRGLAAVCIASACCAAWRRLPVACC